jgi:hypothetical protein
MLQQMFVLNFIMVIVLTLYLAKKSDVNLFIPTIPSIFIWSYLMFSYIGILPLFFFWNEYRYALGINDQEKVLVLWGFSSVALLLVVVVFFLINKVFKLRLKTSYLDYKDIKPTGLLASFALWGVLLVTVFMTYLYISKIPYIPIIEELKGASAEDLARYRSMATNNFQGKLYWYRLFYSSLLTFVSFAYFSTFLKKPSKINAAVFFSTFGLSIFTTLMTTQKAPLFWYIVGLVIVYLITKQKVVNFKVLLFTGLFSFTGLILMYQFFMGMRGRSIFDITKAITSRAFTGQIAPAYFYLDIFPQKLEYLFGRSFPNPRGIFPWDTYSLSVEIMNYMHPDLAAKGIVGSAPTVFWAEMYANLGAGGIIISAIIVGVILYLIQYALFKIELNPITIAYTAWMILYFKDLSFTGLSSFVLDIDFMAVTFIVVILLVLNRFKDIKDYIKKVANAFIRLQKDC